MAPLTVIHEDSSLIAVFKPSGLLTIPGRGAAPEETLQERVARHLGGKAFVVHRLDREASGLMLFAKDAAAHRSLSLLFESRKMKKTYLALVQGRVEKDGAVDKPLRAFGSGRMGVDPGGKPSVTHYRVQERFPQATLLQVEPLTGRRHQIRVHLYSLGHPLLGETRYGREFPLGGVGRLMLHALRLAFPGPQGKPLDLQADPPADFLAVLERFRVDSAV